MIGHVKLFRCDIMWENFKSAKKLEGRIGVTYQSYDKTVEAGGSGRKREVKCCSYSSSRCVILRWRSLVMVV